MADAGLNNTALAKLAGKTRQEIGYYLNGQRFPQLETIQKIAQSLGVKAQDICEDSQEDEEQGLPKIDIPAGMNPANVDDKFKNITDVELVLYLQNMETTRLQSIIYAAVSGKVRQNT